MQPSWMIYGANGYTGKLIAAEAVRRGFRPILAGRSRESIESLGRELGLPTRAFACENPDAIAESLSGISLVLHCAGPFSATSAPMLAASLIRKTHYLDITGEISVFENVFKHASECEKAGIVAMPGVGFDVVPTDCLAAMLKKEMPNAVRLTLAMKSSGAFSPGTLKTVIDGIGSGGAIRRDGIIVSVPTAYRTRMIRFRDKPLTSVTIPWGDVSTAYH